MSVDLDGKWWIQSLFCRMGFARTAATTFKREIPEGAKKEAELVYMHTNVSTLKNTRSLTPLKHAPCSRHTLEKKNAKHVAIAGTSYKKVITGTFVITLERKCLPF